MAEEIGEGFFREIESLMEIVRSGNLHHGVLNVPEIGKSPNATMLFETWDNARRALIIALWIKDPKPEIVAEKEERLKEFWQSVKTYLLAGYTPDIVSNKDIQGIHATVKQEKLQAERSVKGASFGKPLEERYPQVLNGWEIDHFLTILDVKILELEKPQQKGIPEKGIEFLKFWREGYGPSRQDIKASLPEVELPEGMSVGAFILPMDDSVTACQAFCGQNDIPLESEQAQKLCQLGIDIALICAMNAQEQSSNGVPPR